MLRTRVIPCLLLKGETLVKTVRFRQYNYIGDPVNTVRIFNELEVDELCLLDIDATNTGRGPNIELLQTITNECFMPLSYGGGITTVSQAERLFSLGLEKVILNSHAIAEPKVITEIAKRFGSQAVVVSIDAKRKLFGGYAVYSRGGRTKHSLSPEVWASEGERLGAGEILLTSIDRDGTWAGFDSELVQAVAAAVSIPVIASGGASDIDSIRTILAKSAASAVALGSMVVYQRKGMGVLVNFPDKAKLELALE